MVTRRRMLLVVLASVLATLPSPSVAAGTPNGFRVEVLVDGRPACEYFASGTRYIEAVKGKDYAIRLHNPLGVRVAVALSVDGLNTIDARHTPAAEARKWVLGPHETVTISGWQTSLREARRFFFTTEAQSYAERLGQPENIGIISAVFFRERGTRVVPLILGEGRGKDERREPGAPAPAAPRSEAAGAAAQAAPSPSHERKPTADDFAATGMGDRTDHLVRQVHIDLEREAAASIDIRYEYRAQLVRLGIFPGDPVDPLSRRQKSRGFEGPFCPVIK